MRWIRFSRPAFISLFSTAIFSFVITQQITTVAFTAKKTETLAYIAKTRDSSKSNLYTVQANGLSRHQLSEKLDVSQTVVWSKNGRKLAFVSNDDRDSSETNIYVVNADGSRLTQVFSGTGSDSDYVCKGGTSYSIGWTSNDRKLVFTRVCDGINDPGVFSLYVSDTTGIKGTKLIKKWRFFSTSYAKLLATSVK